MNTDDANLPGGSIGTMMKTAYVNGWTDLTVAGTSGPDSFQATTVMDNGKVVHRGTMVDLAANETLQQKLLGLSLDSHQ